MDCTARPWFSLVSADVPFTNKTRVSFCRWASDSRSLKEDSATYLKSEASFGHVHFKVDEYETESKDIKPNTGAFGLTRKPATPLLSQMNTGTLNLLRSDTFWVHQGNSLHRTFCGLESLPLATPGREGFRGARAAAFLALRGSKGRPPPPPVCAMVKSTARKPSGPWAPREQLVRKVY